MPVGQILEALKNDIHPPLYFLMLHVWPWRELVGLRVFSGLWALAAVLLLDRLWVKNWRPAYRILALSLFAFSPCLLLYGRMARSYSMQTALTIATVWCLWRWLRTGKGAVSALAFMLVLLYVHYVPGIALLAAFTMVGVSRLGVRPILAFLSAVALGYFPWLLTFYEALKNWGAASEFGSSYALTGWLPAEQIVKAGYGAVSLSIGESFHAASLLVAPIVLGLALLGAHRAFRESKSLVLLLGVAGVVGFLGVSRWVTYSFVPARLLWMLPFLVLAAAHGVRQLSAAKPALAGLTVGLIGASFATSTLFYFQMKYYANKGYMAPLREIAGRLNRETKSGDLILVDPYETDARALQYYLETPVPMVAMLPKRAALTMSQRQRGGTIWIVRNPRDISPGHLTGRMERAACESRERSEADYLPMDGWQKMALAAFAKEPVSYFYEVVRCSNPTGLGPGGIIQ